MGVGSFLQTTGIASQASDAFDTARQSRRLLSQQEQKNQSELDDSTLYREIVKMAYEHEAAKEAAASAKERVKSAIAAPTAPTAPGSMPVAPTPAVPLFSAGAGQTGPADEEMNYANGGQLGSKFTGIYDDTKVGKRLPTHFNEALSDWSTPGYKHGGMMHLAVHDIVHHANSYADGGEIDPAADEDKKKISDELLSVGVASPQDTNVVVPGLKVTPNPTAIPGRLVNASSGSQSLLSRGGHSATGDGQQEVANGQVESTGDPSIDHSQETNTPGQAPPGLGLALSALGFGPLGALFSLGVLASNASQGPDTSLGQAVANDPEAGVPGGPDDPGVEGVDASTGENAGETGNSGNAGSGNAGFGGDDGEGDAGSSGDSGGDDGGDDGGGGDKNGGILWNYVKARMATKAKKGAVKFKNGGKMRADPGGQVRGPGTGTSDSVRASLSGPSGKKSDLNLSNGEYVLSADTTRAVGKSQLDKLQARYHKQVR